MCATVSVNQAERTIPALLSGLLATSVLAVVIRSWIGTALLYSMSNYEVSMVFIIQRVLLGTSVVALQGR